MLSLANAASGNQSELIADTELSASERNRRLIPYMAFYLPAPELPISQQYAAKHASAAAAAGGPQLRAPSAASASRIPVPVAYMPQPHPLPSHKPLSHYQTGTAELYHTLAIGGHQLQHGLPTLHGKESASTPTADAGATFIAYKPLNPVQKHKTVQHFPPLSHQPEQQQQQGHLEQEQELLGPPHQVQYHRQRGKQSKVNLTPFTAQNTLPGHFIPIIYTPVSKPNGINIITSTNSNNNNNNELHSGNTINYSTSSSGSNSHNNNNKQLPADSAFHKNSHQTQIVTDYASAAVAASAEQGQERLEEVVHPKASVGFNAYNQPALVSLATASTSSNSAPSSASATSTSASKTALRAHQQSPGFGLVNKYESYFNTASDEQQQMTPQEKYVLYLQQRMKQQQQQKQQLPDRYHHATDDLHHHHHHQYHHQSAQSNTKAGKHQHTHTPYQPPTHHTQLHNYNTLYVRPEAGAGQQQQHQQQQVLHIPLRALMGQLHDQSTRHEFPKEPLLGSPAPPQFVDYLIDGPRQSLDEEQQQERQVAAPSRPPQHAFILVTTTAPYTEHQQLPRLHDLSPTRAPILYKQQPTLRLQPVTPVHNNYKATRRPVYISAPTPSETVEITPKYIYVSTNKPQLETSELPSRAPATAPSVKLKPIYKYPSERPHVAPKPSQVYVTHDADQLPDIRTSSLAEILHKLQASNHLPQTLTPDNIDNSIKTLIRILHNLKQTQTIVPNPQQHHETKQSSSSSSNSDSHDYDYSTDSEEEQTKTNVAAGKPVADQLHQSEPNKHPGPSTGRPGIDYPNYAEIPKTSFECIQQRYKGFFGDPETNCQVWHYCDLNGGKASFLCPNGTIFSQIALTCDWWFNVKCSTTSQLYVLNERLYKYILPFNPKFPEDYNGPIVDKYLAMKFQEMEEKMREKQLKSKQQTEKPAAREEDSSPAMPKNHKDSAKHGSGINAQVYEQSSERNLLIDDEIDDISERGTYDTYQAPTTILAPTTTLDAQTLGHRPIVVSSTPEPELETEEQLVPEPEVDEETSLDTESIEEDAKLQSLRDTKSVVGQQQLETTRVDVEKLEVIEIKTDGNTGQLMPIHQLSESSEQAKE